MIAHRPVVVSLLRHLASEASPFSVRRKSATVQLADQVQHETAYCHDPELYALCGIADKVRPGQHARCLFQLLVQSRAGLPNDTRRSLDRIVTQLLLALDAAQVLNVFLALHRARANHKHARRTVLRYLLNHPCLEQLAWQRRPALVDCLEHALGKNVARACARFLAEGDQDSSYVRRHLLRFADNPERAATVVLFLFRKGECPAGQDVVAPLPVGDVSARTEEMPRTITATNRGEIAAALVHIYRGGGNAELLDAVLTQYQSRFELLPGQTGALFFLGDRLAGIEIAPSAAYFREVWTPLVCFCYGVASLELERQAKERPALPFTARNLGELRSELVASREARIRRVHRWLADTPADRLERQEQERYLGLKLFTATGKDFVGQYVEDEGRLVYASLTARTRYLEGMSAASMAS